MKIGSIVQLKSGGPVMTVIKISGNRNTINTFSDNVDFDVTSVLEKNEPVDSAGSRSTNS